jgi:hypothetical protein
MNCINFSSWNLGHTKPLTGPFIRFLDELFGTPGFFSNTHWFFEQCVIVLASYLNPPPTLFNFPRGNPAPCNELWYRHTAGFEGLRHKGWTLVMIGLLFYVEQLIRMNIDIPCHSYFMAL